MNFKKKLIKAQEAIKGFLPILDSVDKYVGLNKLIKDLGELHISLSVRQIKSETK